MRILYRGNYTPKSKELFDFVSREYPEYITEENPELILVAGGDGTMLRSIHHLGHLNVPFFGIGLGTLNFLMNDIYQLDNFFKNIQNIKFEVVKANSLQVSVSRDDDIVFSSFATNDIMLGNGIMDYHNFLINSTDHSFKNTVVNGQSIIVSTAIGSTAISYNNDMNVIPSLNLDLLAFSTVLSKKDEAIKKFVRGNQEIYIDIYSKRQECLLFVDGDSKVFHLKENDKVILTRGKEIRFAFINYDDFELKRLS